MRQDGVLETPTQPFRPLLCWRLQGDGRLLLARMPGSSLTKKRAALSRSEDKGGGRNSDISQKFITCFYVGVWVFRFLVCLLSFKAINQAEERNGQGHPPAAAKGT